MTYSRNCKTRNFSPSGWLVILVKNIKYLESMAAERVKNEFFFNYFFGRFSGRAF